MGRYDRQVGLIGVSGVGGGGVGGLNQPILGI